MKRKKFKTSEGGVFFFSDPHYGHANIVRSISQWTDKENSTRDFQTIEEMNNEIVNNINKMVKPDDTLICVGDWSFGNIKNVAEFRRRIHCKNLHLIYGNHDDGIEDDETLHGHFSSLQHYKEIVVDGIMFCLFHYKQTIWNKSHRDAYHLYGHSHAGAEHMVNGKSMDVGIDNAFRLLGEYRPFTFEEVMFFLKGRKSFVVDHHGAKGTESHK